MKHQELVALANEIFCELEEERSRPMPCGPDFAQLREQIEQERVDLIRDVIRIEAAATYCSCHALAEALLRAITRQQEWYATHDADGRPKAA